jgi:hypothetical protein
MAFQTYVTPDPMGNFAAGNRLAQGQAELQMRQQALQAAEAQRAIDAAKEKKANDFNQMFSLLQFGAAQTNRQQDLAMRQQEMQARLGMQSAELDRQGRLDGLAERRVAAYEQSLQDRGNNSADAVMATLISGQAPMATPAPDATVPMPQAVGDVAPSVGDFGEPVLPDALPGAVQEPLVETPPPPEGLFPGPDLGVEGPAMPPGPSGQPGVPDALLMRDIQGTGVEQGAEPPPSFATSDPGVSRWLRKSEDIQAEIRASAAARQEAAGRASQIRVLLPRVEDPKIAAAAAAKYGELARQDAEQQATLQVKESDLKTARLRAQRAQQVQATMQTLAPLDNILPAGDMARITKSLENAGDLPDTAPPVRQLADLAKYQKVRNALNMTEPSNGVATAHEVVRAYEALQSDDVIQGRNAVRALGVLQKGLPTGEVGQDGMPVRKVPATTDANYAAWAREVSTMEAKAQPYFEAESRFRAAREGDIRRPEPEAAAAPAAQPAAPAAPAAASVQEGKVSLATPVPRPAAPPSTVDAWWTAQKQKFSAAKAPITGADGVQRRESLADFDNATLQAIIDDAPMYRLKDGGLTLDPPPDDPRQRAVKDLYVYEEAPWVAVDHVAARFGYDSEETAPGGSDVSNTRNMWADVTIGMVIQEAAREELARRGVNAGGANKPPPLSAEETAVQDKILNSAKR